MKVSAVPESTSNKSSGASTGLFLAGRSAHTHPGTLSPLYGHILSGTSRKTHRLVQALDIVSLDSSTNQNQVSLKKQHSLGTSSYLEGMQQKCRCHLPFRSS
ncbi:hypothetical protein KCU83_g140, partial [Aureobasidium melanogenum]